mgnify:CR=1 FL=1
MRSELREYCAAKVPVSFLLPSVQAVLVLERDSLHRSEVGARDSRPGGRLDEVLDDLYPTFQHSLRTENLAAQRNPVSRMLKVAGSVDW